MNEEDDEMMKYVISAVMFQQESAVEKWVRDKLFDSDFVGKQRSGNVYWSRFITSWRLTLNRFMFSERSTL